MSATAASPAATSAARQRAERQSRAALGVLLAGAILICFSAIFVKASELGPVATGFYRMFLALPVFAIAMVRERWRHPLAPLPRSRSDWRTMMFCGLFLAADLAAWHWSIHMTSVANASLLGNLAPIFVTLIGWLFYGEKFRPLFLLGLALAILGAAMLLGVSFHLGGRPFHGDLIATGVGSLYAGYIMTLSRLRQRFSTATVMAVSGSFTCLALLPLALLSGESLIAHSLHGWLMLFGLAWLSQVAGQGAIAWSMAHLPASFGAVALLITPVAAALFAWPILGEAIGPLQALGGLVVLAGIALARLGSMARRQR
jgi:drug/metabolite transporter (DMT)-like permease